METAARVLVDALMTAAVIADDDMTYACILGVVVEVVVGVVSVRVLL